MEIVAVPTEAEELHPIEVAAAAVGSQKELAKLIGMSPQGVTKMKKTRILAERVLEIERVSGVSRHRLRPDLYPLEACPKCGFVAGAPSRRARVRHSKPVRGQEAR